MTAVLVIALFGLLICSPWAFGPTPPSESEPTENATPDRGAQVTPSGRTTEEATDASYMVDPTPSTTVAP